MLSGPPTVAHFLHFNFRNLLTAGIPQAMSGRKTLATAVFMKPLIQYLLLGLSVLAFAGGTASAANSGHMLDNIELIPGEKTSYLTLKGYFEPELFQEISVQPDESGRETLVVIPNAFINNLLIPNREFNQFPVENLIRQIQLEEDIREEAGNQVRFLVNLKISLAQEMEIALEIEKSTPRQLTFSLIPSGRLVSPDTDKAEVTDVLAQPPPEESVLLHPVFAMLAYRQPIRLNVSVLNASRHVGGAQRLAILLERQQRRRIEQRVGMRLEVVNISSVQEQMILPRTKIYYRPNMLKSAITLADIIPGEQTVEPMPLNRGTKPTTDVEIYVGQNFE